MDHSPFFECRLICHKLAEIIILQTVYSQIIHVYITDHKLSCIYKLLAARLISQICLISNIFLVMKVVFILAKSVDPNEMPVLGC